MLFFHSPIKFYYEKVLGQPRRCYTVSRAKREKTLPDVLSKDEEMCIRDRYDNLYLAAKARSESDWLVGINGTQALSIAAGHGTYRCV